jgi:hypothetical protein
LIFKSEVKKEKRENIKTGVPSAASGGTGFYFGIANSLRQVYK